MGWKLVIKIILLTSAITGLYGCGYFSANDLDHGPIRISCDNSGCDIRCENQCDVEFTVNQFGEHINTVNTSQRGNNWQQYSYKPFQDYQATVRIDDETQASASGFVPPLHPSNLPRHPYKKPYWYPFGPRHYYLDSDLEGYPESRNYTIRQHNNSPLQATNAVIAAGSTKNVLIWLSTQNNETVTVLPIDLQNNILIFATVDSEYLVIYVESLTWTLQIVTGKRDGEPIVRSLSKEDLAPTATTDVQLIINYGLSKPTVVKTENYWYATFINYLSPITLRIDSKNGESTVFDVGRAAPSMLTSYTSQTILSPIDTLFKNDNTILLKESYKYIQYELTSDSTSPVTNVQIFEPTILSKLVTTDDVNIRQTHDNVIAWVPDDGVYDTTELYTAASSSTNKPPPAIFFDCEPRFVLQYSDKTIVQFLDGRTFNYENTKTVQSRFDTSIEADPAFGILDSLPKPTHAGWIDTRVCPEDVK